MTAAQKRRAAKIVTMGCLICGGEAEIHHIGTGAGGRRDHSRIVPLCPYHHRGPNGIDGRQKYSKKTWQQTFMTEPEMESRVKAFLALEGVAELIG